MRVLDGGDMRVIVAPAGAGFPVHVGVVVAGGTGIGRSIRPFARLRCIELGQLGTLAAAFAQLAREGAPGP